MNATRLPPASTTSGSSQPLLVGVTSLVLGAALTGAWFRFHAPAAAVGPDATEISATTRNILAHLSQPVTIRYYSLLPAGSADDAVQAFAGRVDRLLAAMEEAAGGNLQLVRVDQPAGTNADAADADGIQAFNLDKGDACFLGLAVAGGKKKESLARLYPEWEPALQYDIDRAIERVDVAPAPAQSAPAIAKTSPETVAFVKQLIPDVSVISVADADQIFHQQFLNECAAAGTELEKQINAAQQQVAKAQAGGSVAEVEAATQQLQQVQLSQAEKLKEIAANLQLRLAAFEELKAAANSAK
jgi:hypothetical protein